MILLHHYTKCVNQSDITIECFRVRADKVPDFQTLELEAKKSQDQRRPV